jgi:tetratricopeptide (TPR) repeat protein/TolB-like protein/tRNA A-37 threonylcarbamoyl transferase component Bud32
MADHALAHDSLIGLEFGHYRIDQKIGSGGMGAVYRARDAHLDREVAVKVLNPGTLADEVSRRRFRQEALLLSKLSHPNIAIVHDFYTEQGRDFLVMEYIPGLTLNEKLANGALPEEEVLRLGLQLCDGLAAAHGHSIVHCDLKPGNVRLTNDGRVKILDFGLARLRRPASEDDSTASGLSHDAISGTLPYMAPEQLNGEEIDARTDIYGAGVMLYELSTGQRPYSGLGAAKLISAILHRPPVPPRMVNQQISPALEWIVEKCLEKEPKNRYQSVRELARDLQNLQKSKDTGIPLRRTSGGILLPALEVRRSAVWWAAGILLAVVAIAAMSGSFRERVRTWLGLSRIPHTKQVVVLPFRALGNDAELAAFGAGLTETLTAKLTELTRDPTLQVIPATEVRSKHIATVDQARKEFGANLALEGSLHAAAGQVRINYILVDVQTHRQLRGNSVTFAADDPFAAQDAVVDGAIGMLELEVQGADRGALSSHGTQVAGAYDYYLQGRGYLQNYDRIENLDSAIQVFERALALDKNYALAYAGLGEAYWEKYDFTREVAWLDKSRENCQQANRLDSALPSAHVCMGKLHLNTGNYLEAATEFEKALQPEPTNDEAYRGLATAYERMGKPDEAEKTYRRAISQRPHYWATYNWLGAYYYRQARFPEASQMFRQVIALAPDSVRGYSNLGASYLDEARYLEAISASERSIAIQPSDYGYSNLGSAYFFLKRYDDADRAFLEAVKLTPKDPLLWWNLGDGYYWTPGKRDQSVAAYKKCIEASDEALRVNPNDAGTYGIAAICYAMLGEKSPALASLQRGLQIAPDDPTLAFQAALIYNQFLQTTETIHWLKKARASGLSEIRIRDYPNFDSLRSDRRFQDIFQAQ